jgi:phosphoglycolate phosphatase
MRYKAVIFDLDGTLLDTLADIANTMNSVLDKLGFPVFRVDDYKNFIGNGIRVLVTRTLPEKIQNNKLISDCVEDFREIYLHNINKSTKVYKGIPDLLDRLTKKNIKLSVLSNKHDDLAKESVSGLLSDWKFEVVQGRLDGLPLKPDPTGALQIAEFMGVHPHEIILTGDSGVDMQTGTAAGMFTAGALWGFRGRRELEDSGAKMLIERPQDLLTLF